MGKLWPGIAARVLYIGIRVRDRRVADKYLSGKAIMDPSRAAEIQRECSFAIFRSSHGGSAGGTVADNIPTMDLHTMRGHRRIFCGATIQI